MVRNTLVFLLKAALSGGLIWYLMSQLDMETIKRHLVGLDPVLLAGASAVFLGHAAIGAARWVSVAKAIRGPLPFTVAFRLFYIGMFFNQALPGGSGGDAVRIYMAYRQGLSASAAFNGVFIERLVIILGLMLLIAGLHPLLAAKVALAERPLVYAAAAVIVFGGLSGLLLFMYLDRLPRRFHHWRIVRGLCQLGTDLRHIFSSVSRAGTVLFWGVVGNVNLSLCFFLLARSLDLEVGFVDCLVLIPPVLLFINIPVTIGGWGLRESATIVAFSLIGVASEGALALSVLFGLTSLILSLPGGLVWLASGHRHRDVRQSDLGAN